jgi:hypothetical protein
MPLFFFFGFVEFCWTFSLNQCVCAHLGNEEKKSLPVTKDMQLLTYQGWSDDDEVQGILLIYHDFGAAYGIEQILATDSAKRNG